MSDLKKITERIIKFRDERDWKKYHNPKDLALSLVLESTELLEYFQWKNDNEVKSVVVEEKKGISQELSDILYYLLLISEELNIDLLKSFEEKMTLNEKKYPVEKVKGSNKKYNKF